MADRRELVRRMVFDVTCGNRDDPLKNHAFVRRDGGWPLSQAFDLSPGDAREIAAGLTARLRV
ncbi:HipA domain-containing protein [Methylobacterium sp. Leaf118]|uniref:HipA domain-containing protein n=1 Tax=Methylobacterium sp. Leaf118 TaxID=2876562 RepID=UPI001E2B9866|nr:HipA domain-containing protein [Methylobacterium sp. Leaf118]